MSPGDIVFYRIAGSPAERVAWRPAIVTYAHEDGTLDLFVCHRPSDLALAISSTASSAPYVGAASPAGSSGVSEGTSIGHWSSSIP